MSQPTHLLTLDFGTGFIRVARTNIANAQLANLHPQIIEFGRRRSLRNTVCLSEDGHSAQEVGEDVFENELAYDMPELIRQWVPLDAEANSEVGKVVRFLLARVQRAVELQELSEEERASWQTVIAAPPGFSASESRQLKAILETAGFPTVQVLDSALAALTWHTRDNNQRGRYLVIDCGASATRVTVCQIGKDGVRRRVLHSNTDRPAGRDFDRAIANLVQKQFPELQSSDSMSELMYFAEEFKEHFSRQWATGEQAYEALCRLSEIPEIFALSVAQFQQQNIAGHLITNFSESVSRTLDEANYPPTELAGIVLVGGGALWPFIQEWIKSTFAGIPLLSNDYPEESIVRGLALLHAMTSATATARETPLARGTNEPLKQQTAQPLAKRSPVNPTLAFILELGGLVGFLGLGWLFVLGNIPLGFVAMAFWWIILIMAFLFSGALAFSQGSGWLLLLGFFVWIAGPLLSGYIARTQALAHNRRVIAGRKELESNHQIKEV